MRYLLDTNVISETRKTKRDDKVVAWFEGVDQDDLFLSVLTLGELAKGIAIKRRKDPRAAAALDRWRTGIVEVFTNRVIPVDVDVATAWAEISAIRTLPVIDSLLAATAKVHGLALVTRNIRDVSGLGVELIDPWRG